MKRTNRHEDWALNTIGHYNANHVLIFVLKSQFKHMFLPFLLWQFTNVSFTRNTRNSKRNIQFDSATVINCKCSIYAKQLHYTCMKKGICIWRRAHSECELGFYLGTPLVPCIYPALHFFLLFFFFTLQKNLLTFLEEIK